MSKRDSTLVPAVSEGQPHDYSTFIQQLEISTVYLQSARIENKSGPEAPAAASVLIQGMSGFTNGQGTIRVLHTYKVRLHAVNEPDAVFFELDASFVVDYRSRLPMTPVIFETFKDVNLPLNTWPYFREYLGSTMARSNWVPYTLPVFFVPGEPAHAPKPAPRKRKTQATHRLEASQ